MTRRRVLTVAVVATFVVALVAVVVSTSRPRATRFEGLPTLRYGAGDASEPAMARLGRVIYEVHGTLPALDGTAPAYRIEPDGSNDRVAAVAVALGVAADHVVADPKEKPDVRSAPLLLVMRGAWNLLTLPQDCTLSSDGSMACAATGVGTAGPGVATSSGASDCPMPPCPAGQACAQVCAQPAPAPVPSPPPTFTTPPPPARPAGLPTRAEAEQIGRSVLAKAGVDLAHADVAVTDDFSFWDVTASPRIDGFPTIGLESSVSIGPKSAVVGGHGSLFTVHKVGDYPLAGTTTGLERLRNGWLSGPRPLGGVTSIGGQATAVTAVTAVGTAAQCGAPPGGSPPRSVPGVPTTLADVCRDTGVIAPAPPAPAPSPAPPVAPVLPDQKQPLPPDGPVTTVPDETIVITGVHVALMRSFAASGDETVAPVYVFETEPTVAAGESRPPLTVAPVPAVVDRLLDTGAPVPEPASGKTEPAPLPPTKQG